MGRRGKLIFVLMAIFVLCVFICCYYHVQYTSSKKTSFVYSENEKTLENPGRGFYMQIDYSQTDLIEEAKNRGFQLVFANIRLGDFFDGPISQEALETFRVLLGKAREHEVMLIVRAAYLWDDTYEEPEMSRIHEHITQLAEVMNEYKDVVLVVQTGMLGWWGEWHGGLYLNDEESMRTEAIQVVKWWLEELDEEIVLDLRRPVFIQTAIEEGCDASRLGMHNDALLATDNDMGTYVDRGEDLAWCETYLNGKVNGGEMPNVSQYTELENVLKEFDELSITYLNAYYNVAVLDDWKAQTINGENALEYIEKKLGYRYHVKEITVNDSIYPYTSKLQIDLKLANSGFSSIQSRFHLYLVLDDGTQKRYIRLDKVNTEKQEERYTHTIEIEDMKEFRIGFCYMDASEEEYDKLPENVHTVEFANEAMEYSEGVNYCVSYQYVEDDSQTLKAVQIMQ